MRASIQPHVPKSLAGLLSVWLFFFSWRCDLALTRYCHHQYCMVYGI